MEKSLEGMGWQVGGRFWREGTYVYLWLIQAEVWQKPTQYYKAVILQLKILKSQVLFTKTHLKIMIQDG